MFSTECNLVPMDIEENTVSVPARKDMKSKILGPLGGSSSGIGMFGAVHNVCHYSCQGIIALLAVFGISAVGMPLGFLLDPLLVMIFSSIGLASITLSIIVEIKHPNSLYNKNNLFGDDINHQKIIKRQIFTNRKILLFFAFGTISLVSLALGTNDFIAKQNGAAAIGSGEPILSLDSLKKTNSNGDTSIEITYDGMSKDLMSFTVSMDTNNMDAPPLSQYDLTKLSSLVIEGSNGRTEGIKPLSWTVQETGHMGHHLKGTLTFPATIGEQENNNYRSIIDDQTKSFEIVINDIAGVKQKVFSWSVVASS